MAKKRLRTMLTAILLTLVLLVTANVSIGQAVVRHDDDATSSLGMSVVDADSSLSGGDYPLTLPPTPTPVPEVSSYNTPATFSFKQIGQSTMVLDYPSVAEVYFRLPAQWLLQPDSALTLHYDLDDPSQVQPEAIAAEPEMELVEPAREQHYPGVSVYVNEVPAGSFYPVAGKSETITLPIPIAATVPADNPTNAYTIRIEYLTDNDEYCDYLGVLSILDDSSVRMSFMTARPLLDLSDFPLPLVQNSFMPEKLQIIVPDDVSANDLAAAASVAAAVGNTAASDVRFNVLRAGQATAEVLQRSSAVVIGQPERNAFLKHLYELGVLPTALSGAGIVDTAQRVVIEGTDGVLQLVPSPVNADYTLLIVTGGSDVGVKRAARALASPSVGQEGVLAVMKGDSVAPPVTSEVLSFADLGVASRDFYGLGRSGITVRFFVPRDWQIQDGAVLVLYYAHSSNLNTRDSSITVRLNGRPTASAQIDVSRGGEKRAVIPLGRRDIVPGSVNVLRVDTVASAQLWCTYQWRSYWLSIRDSSYIRLPHGVLSDPTQMAPVTHPAYYLAYEPDVTISLPAAPTQIELNGMVDFAGLLGREGQATKNFSVSLDTQADLAGLAAGGVVVIGKPSSNPQIGKLNDKLPQPFVAGEDALKQQTGPVVYRTPQGMSIGLVEVLSAPWNPARAITLITGTTDEGLKWALDSVSDPGQVNAFSGDISFVGRSVVKSYASSLLAASIALEKVSVEVSGETLPLEQVTPTASTTPGATIGTSPVSTVSPDRYEKPATSPTEVMSRRIRIYLLAGLAAVGVLLFLFVALRLARGGRRG
jgi:hypothetical protein